ncbi:MAG TPA: tRNA lysidine(34) synthetase TilS, partial [Deltaproteobacteria bacterium]|nr:tRNA lysidine(34) synthetase TilS [Deltaproteobacteria bacterium]
IDSMVLLDLMQRAAPAVDLRLGVIHVDHGLRVEESKRDASWVRKQCRTRGLRFHLKRLHMGPQTPNAEEEARRLRYQAVTGCMRRHGYACAATGHTLDDQAETVLYRIIRGTGIRGLAGMDQRRRDGIIRPMLHMDRSMVLRYAALEGIPHVEDRTNADVRHDRNRIRHDIMPLMERINPRIAQSITALAAIARLEGEALEGMASGLERTARKWDWGLSRAYLIPALRTAHEAVIRRVIITVMASMTGEERGIDASQVDAVLAVLAGERSAHAVRRKVRVSRDKDLLVFQRMGEGPWYAREVSTGGGLAIPEIHRTVNIILPERLDKPLLVRPFSPGDRISGRRVAHILSSMRVPRGLRELWPVLASDHGCVAVASYRNAGSGIRMSIEGGYGA